MRIVIINVQFHISNHRKNIEINFKCLINDHCFFEIIKISFINL